MAAPARAPLTRDRIVRAAVDLADASGIDAVTMRRLGDELGFEAMSLYRHVAGKEALLEAMLDLVLDEWQLPAQRGPVADAIRSSARSVHEGLRRHPWAAQLLVTGTLMRPRRLAYIEALLARLRDAGLDADTTYRVYHLLDGFIFGFSLWEIAYTGAADPGFADRAARLMEQIPWDEYPNLADHRDQHMTDGPHREASPFDLGLDLILASLQ